MSKLLSGNLTRQDVVRFKAARSLLPGTLKEEQLRAVYAYIIPEDVIEAVFKINGARERSVTDYIFICCASYRFLLHRDQSLKESYELGSDLLEFLRPYVS